MSDDPFYVGYLPLPGRDWRFLKWLLPVCLVVVAGMGLLIGAGQRDPGPGQWEVDKEITLEGTVSVDPYAILHTREEATMRAVLLVEEGKFGAAQRLEPIAGKYVRLRGTLIHRDGRSMLEISSAVDAVATATGEAFVSPAVRLGAKTLRGEVIDPKCYIGAMKPGGGKTHKACAELCLAGGIPPMLAAWDDSGKELYYLLLNGDGTPANAAAAPLAGETVTLAGIVEQRDDLLILRLNPEALRK